MHRATCVATLAFRWEHQAATSQRFGALVDDCSTSTMPHGSMPTGACCRLQMGRLPNFSRFVTGVTCACSWPPSPTTRYRDYAISPDLIHWQSQSVTRADSETGKRYCEHRARGTSVMLFARLRTDDRAFSFLGPADYVSHEGELPMSIAWRLQYPLPGDLFAAFAAAVA
jgi:hypothetical protein